MNNLILPHTTLGHYHFHPFPSLHPAALSSPGGQYPLAALQPIQSFRLCCTRTAAWLPLQIPFAHIEVIVTSLSIGCQQGCCLVLLFAEFFAKVAPFLGARGLVPVLLDMACICK